MNRSTPAELGLKRQRLLYGDGTGRESEDEPLELISRRLIGSPEYSTTSHRQSPFVLEFMRRYGDRIRKMAEAEVVEAEVISAPRPPEAEGGPIRLDLSPGSGELDPAEPAPPGIRSGARLMVTAVGLRHQTPIFSARAARGRQALSTIESSWAGGIPVSGRLLDRLDPSGGQGSPVPNAPVSGNSRKEFPSWRIGGGWVVDLDGFYGALPAEEASPADVGSESETPTLGAPEALIRDVGPPGAEGRGAADPLESSASRLKFSVIHYDSADYCVILSRKKFLAEHEANIRRRAPARFSPGQIVSGTVIKIGPTSARINLAGGFPADLSGENAGHGPAHENLAALVPGQRLQVFVLDISREKIDVGLRQLTPDPWAFVRKVLQEGSRLTVTLQEVRSDRLVVQLPDGLRGEIPLKEAAWQFWDAARLTDQFQPGASVEAVCLSILREERRIILSIKAVQPDPLPDIQRRYAVGTRTDVTVLSWTDEVARVQTQDGYLGVIGPEDLSWTGPVSPRQFFSGRSGRTQAEVLQVDPQTRLIRFGVKQVKPDPFVLLSREIEVGRRYVGTVVRNIPAGSLVELRKGLVGLLRKSEYAAEEAIPAEGATLEVQVQSIQPQQRRMALSRRAVVEQEEKRDIQMFLSEGKAERRVAMKDLLPTDIFRQFFPPPSQIEGNPVLGFPESGASGTGHPCPPDSSK
ncbi:30S ribosomal protein S1 [bacterium]|nr:30S ribosomal protein S1 [bacterium]